MEVTTFFKQTLAKTPTFLKNLKLLGFKGFLKIKFRECQKNEQFVADTFTKLK